jgi:hypothetical protein
MFTRFLERKLWASKNEDLVDITYFDENIRAKYNKYAKNKYNVSLKSLNLYVYIATRTLFSKR